MVGEKRSYSQAQKLTLNAFSSSWLVTQQSCLQTCPIEFQPLHLILLWILLMSSIFLEHMTWQLSIVSSIFVTSQFRIHRVILIEPMF